ncbi:MAG: hypothetical protein JWO33_417 [Caulobacteraceae bacterium]|nr:hypothetical protein [Caulobacteraceae bacterium]
MKKPAPRLLLLGFLAILVAALAVVAAIAAAPPRPRFLSATQLAPESLLAPPPAEGSPQAAAELAELRAITRGASAAQYAEAEQDGRTKSAAIFAGVMGPGFDLKALPATHRLMAEVRHEQKAATGRAKDQFRRKRPWIVDASIKSCGRMDLPRSSYPSSHAALAYAMAAVLADLSPDRAPALMARAQAYGNSRLICGMHFRSDVEAGRRIGTEVAALLLRDPAFQADRRAAAAELKAAGLIR